MNNFLISSYTSDFKDIWLDCLLLVIHLGRWVHYLVIPYRSWSRLELFRTRRSIAVAVIGARNLTCFRQTDTNLAKLRDLPAFWELIYPSCFPRLSSLRWVAVITKNRI